MQYGRPLSVSQRIWKELHPNMPVPDWLGKRNEQTLAADRAEAEAALRAVDAVRDEIRGLEQRAAIRPVERPEQASPRHGLFDFTPLLPGEDADALAELTSAFEADHGGGGAVERALAGRMVHTLWRLGRVGRAERALAVQYAVQEGRSGSAVDDAALAAGNTPVRDRENGSGAVMLADELAGVKVATPLQDLMNLELRLTGQMTSLARMLIRLRQDEAPPRRSGKRRPLVPMLPRRSPRRVIPTAPPVKPQASQPVKAAQPATAAEVSPPAKAPPSAPTSSSAIESAVKPTSPLNTARRPWYLTGAAAGARLREMRRPLAAARFLTGAVREVAVDGDSRSVRRSNPSSAAGVASRGRTGV